MTATAAAELCNCLLMMSGCNVMQCTDCTENNRHSMKQDRYDAR